MNIIFLGVSIIALLTATESFAMLGAYDMELNPHYIGTRSDSQRSLVQPREEDREEFTPSKEPLFSLVMNNRIYLGSSRQFLPGNEILSLCEEALKSPFHTPKQLANIYLNYAGTLLRTDKYIEALSAFERALDVKDSKEHVVVKGRDRARTLFDKANAFEKLGKYDEAARVYEVALEIFESSSLYPFTSSDRIKTHLKLAIASSIQGEKNRAIVTFKNILGLKHTTGRVMLAGLDRAKTYCQLASILDKKPEASLYYYKALNLKDEGADLLLTGLDRAKALYNLACGLEEQKRYDEAIKAYNEAIGLQDLMGRKLLEEIVPYIISKLKLLSHRVNLRDLTEKMRKECASINLKPHIQLLLGQLPNEERAQILLTLAENSKELNQYDSALEFYRQALIEEDPNGSFVLTDQEIARVLGQIEEIFAEKERYVAQDKKDNKGKKKTPSLNPRKRTYQSMNAAPAIIPNITFQKPKGGI